MIDLSKRKQELYKIKLEDGTILKIKNPTQSTLRKMIELQQLKDNDVELIDELFILLTDIFNRNMNKIEFTRQDIEEMLDLSVAMEVLQDYLDTTLSNLGK